MACSLVCKQWLPPSRYQLFRNTTIHIDVDNFRKFCELLASQRLNAYLGRLHLESHIIDDRFVGGPEDAFQFNQDLGRLAGLPNLQFLRLEYHHDELIHEFPAVLANSFTSITDLEFVSFWFSTFDQFVEIVESLPLLCRVSLDEIGWYDLPDNDEDLVSDPSRPTYGCGNLRDVVLRCGFHSPVPVLLWLPFQMRITRLTLALGPWQSMAHLEGPLLTRSLHSFGSQLEHMIFGSPSGYVPDLSQAKQLHTLELTEIPCTNLSMASDCEWVPTLLSQIHSPLLRRIVFVIDLGRRENLDFLNWPRIHEQLTRLSSLRFVEFALPSHKHWATIAISERLDPRQYSLQVRQLDGPYKYSLGMFNN
ncbi:hypothetical protein R3P38DRAFT_2502577 [Favolaschia claudopus]|uniref:F-box domain-containing protein n=1 Tax=Favolaschia claudopus TaxID=2862362 RepID=A0AAW0DN90_9AGAR